MLQIFLPRMIHKLSLSNQNQLIFYSRCLFQQNFPGVHHSVRMDSSVLHYNKLYSYRVSQKNCDVIFVQMAISPIKSIRNEKSLSIWNIQHKCFMIGTKPFKINELELQVEVHNPFYKMGQISCDEF